MSKTLTITATKAFQQHHLNNSLHLAAPPPKPKEKKKKLARFLSALVDPLIQDTFATDTIFFLYGNTFDKAIMFPILCKQSQKPEADIQTTEHGSEHESK